MRFRIDEFEQTTNPIANDNLSNMLNSAFDLVARFSFPSEDCPEMTVQQTADFITARHQRCRIDWELGRKKIAEDVERLKRLNAPDIIWQGHAALADKTLFVGIAGPDGQCQLSGYTHGFSWYDGCLDLRCEPFDFELLRREAVDLSAALELTFDLNFGSVGDLNFTVRPGNLTPTQMLSPYFDSEHFAKPVVTPLPAWRERLTIACEMWLGQHPEPTVTSKWIAEFGTGHELARQLIKRIDSVEPVETAHRIDFGDGKWNSLLVLNYPNWTAELGLPGVPKPLLG